MRAPAPHRTWLQLPRRAVDLRWVGHWAERGRIQLGESRAGGSIAEPAFASAGYKTQSCTKSLLISFAKQAVHLSGNTTSNDTLLGPGQLLRKFECHPIRQN